MERETKDIVTPVGKTKLVLNTYITGREYEYCQEPLLEALSVRSNGSDLQTGDVNIRKIRESTHRLLEKFVVSVDGKTDKVVDKLLDLRQEDYQFVVDKVNELSKKN